MATEILKGTTFADGNVVHAADLNALVDSAVILSALISNQSPVSPAAGDHLLLLQGGNLRQVTVASLGTGTVTNFSSGSLTGLFTAAVTNPATTPALAFTMASASGNKFLASPAGGGSGALSLRAIVPADIAITSVVILSNIIDCSQGNVFTKDLVANITFSFSNQYSGQVIKVILKQQGTGAYTVGWPTGLPMHWKGGIVPVMTTGVGKVDIFSFIFQPGGTIYAQADQNF